MTLLEADRRDSYSAVFKRAMDLVVCALIATAFAVPAAAIILTIKLDSPGPVFFRQWRKGRGGRLFRIIKFRTLHTEHQDRHASMLASDGDARVTRVGRFMRRYHLDELPQIANVLAGEMSIVGPRPHAIGAKAGGEPYAAICAEYERRYSVLPGITGWAQVNGWRGATDSKEQLRQRLRHDLYYIDNWSIWLDWWIILRTPYAMIRTDITAQR